jgi:hypothetical protein
MHAYIHTCSAAKRELVVDMTDEPFFLIFFCTAKRELVVDMTDAPSGTNVQPAAKARRLVTPYSHSIKALLRLYEGSMKALLWLY